MGFKRATIYGINLEHHLVRKLNEIITRMSLKMAEEEAEKASC